MYLLTLDTATNSGGVALSRNAEVIGLAQLKTPLRYSEKILYYVDFLLDQLDLNLNQIELLAVANGPGSFTGLRIGLATVKAFAEVLDRPVVAVSTLEALAWRFRSLHPRVAPMIDARRQQVFAAVYAVGDDLPRQVHPPAALPPAEWLRQLDREDCLFVGDGARMYASTVQAALPQARLLGSDNAILSEVADLAYRRFLRGEVLRAEQVQACYVRPSDAELGQVRVR